MGVLPFNPDLIEHTLEIYNVLLEDKTLGLDKNIQGDITEEMRQTSIRLAAEKMAKKSPLVTLAY